MADMTFAEAKEKLSKQEYQQFLKEQGVSEVTANFYAGIETGKITGDYTVKKSEKKEEKEMADSNDFMGWMLPGGEEAAHKEEAAPAADGKKPLHIAVGESLNKFGVSPTKDLYGVHAEEHGSAWVAPKKQFQALTKAMWQMGYRPGGKGIFKRGPVQIDMGQDADNVFLYITDDNGPKVVTPGSAAKKKEAVTKKEQDGNHPANHYLVVEDKEQPTTWHLLVKDSEGEPDRKHMGAAYAALTVGFRGNKYAGPDKDKALKALKEMYHEMGENFPGEGEE